MGATHLSEHSMRAITRFRSAQRAGIIAAGPRTRARLVAASLAVDAARDHAPVAAAVFVVLAGLVLLIARSLPGTGPAAAISSVETSSAPPAISARIVCSFSNDDARAAMVSGADGGASLVIGGRTYWLFGDTTFLPESGKQIEQNSVAWSDGSAPGGCPQLHYYSRDGIAVPFLPKDGSLTVWPTGAWADTDHSFDFYTVYIYGSGPYAYWIGEIGLAHFDTATMQSTVITRDLWDAKSGPPEQIIGVQPVDRDGDGRLRLVLQTLAGNQLLARVDPARAADRDAYEFWDGDEWSPAAANARPLWSRPHPADPVQSLASFSNGANVAYDAQLGKYVAVENMGIATIGARTADRLEGRWSEPRPWIDCDTVAAPAVPTCYSPFQHVQLASSDGRHFFVTFTRLATYDVVLADVTLGTAVHEYHGDAGRVAYGTHFPDGDAWHDAGVVFHASDEPLPGFAPVYRWNSDGDTRYAIESPGSDFVRGDVAFYAPGAPALADSTVRYRPVFDWRKGSVHLLAADDRGLDEYGFERGDIAFYAP